MVLCQRCHRRYDRQFQRKEKQHLFRLAMRASTSSRTGVQRSLRCLHLCPTAGCGSSLPDGTPFEIYLEINQPIVGNGWYLRRDDR